MLDVHRISASEAKPWILERHYAKRMPPIEHAFGAFMRGMCCGIVTYGTPSSATLREGVCGTEYSHLVLELNRLCCHSVKNLASTLVGQSLNQLPKPSIVVSYADTAQGHVGYVYQATNWIYTGLSAKRTDWHVDGMDLHGQTIADMSRGKPDRAKWMRDKFGDRFSLVDRPRKHRYIYFTGNKRERRNMLKALRYQIEQYPKGESHRYDTEQPIETQSILNLDNA